jgi:hypothetical protein
MLYELVDGVRSRKAGVFCGDSIKIRSGLLRRARFRIALQFMPYDKNQVEMQVIMKYYSKAELW